MSRRQKAYDDPDSKTAEHDRIVSWLYEHVDKMIAEKFPLQAEADLLAMIPSVANVFKKEITTVQHKVSELEKKMLASEANPTEGLHTMLGITRHYESYYHNGELEQQRKHLLHLESIDQTVPQLPDILPIVADKKREKIITEESRYSKRLIGSVDLQVMFQIKHFSLSCYDYRSTSSYFDTKEKFLSTPTWKPQWHGPFKWNFEVKSRINSFSEVLRQVRIYQEYENGEYFVVCPDETFAEDFVKEGINFIKAPDEYRPRETARQQALW